MRELEKPFKIVPDVQLVAEFHKEYTLKLSLAKRRGLTLWAVKLGAGEAKKVEVKPEVMVGLDRQPVRKNRAHYDPEATYVWALDEYNALRKVEREFMRFVERKEKEK